jgi:hypothetical protein
VVGGPTDGRDIVISDHYEAKKRQLKGHGWRFGETHESFSTASVSRPSAGATVGLLSARSGNGSSILLRAIDLPEGCPQDKDPRHPLSLTARRNTAGADALRRVRHL